MKIEIQDFSLNRSMRPILVNEHPYNKYEAKEVVDVLFNMKLYPEGASQEEVGKEIDRVMGIVLKAGEQVEKYVPDGLCKRCVNEFGKCFQETSYEINWMGNRVVECSSFRLEA
jgi:hypothetical protein